MVKAKFGISDILAIYILIWSVTPIMASGTIYRIALILCSVIWIALHIDFLTSNINMTLAVIILIAYTFILRAINGGFSSGVSWTINTAIYSLVAIIAAYYLEFKLENVQLFLEIMMVCTAIVSLISIQTVINDPTSLRTATHEWDQGANSYGAYSYVYMCVQAVPALFIVLRTNVLRRNNIIWTLLSSLTFILYAILIILSGFTLANIISIVGLAICLILINPSIGKKIILMLVLLIVIFWYKDILEALFSFLLSVTKNSPMYTTKIKELADQFLNGATFGDSYVDRVSLYKESWNAVFRYPLLGSVYWTGNIVGGGHSTFVDVLAYGGVFYSAVYYWQMIVFPVKQINSANAPKLISRVLIMTFLITNLLTGLFDTVTYANAWVWFLLFPYLAKKAAVYTQEEIFK